MSTTKIEWTSGPDGSPGKTWNPIRGCSRVSPGCKHCYAERMCARGLPELKSPTTGENFAIRKSDGPHWTGKVELIESALLKPLKWRKPCRVFVNSMSDLFHEAVPDEWIGRIFAVMALCPQHTFQCLTKRADRLYRYMSDETLIERLEIATHDCMDEHEELNTYLYPWPLPNVWLGVSAEDQQRAYERIPWLLKTPASVRFVSAEPLLGPLDLWQYLGGERNPIGPAYGGRGLDWVIAGGESGPGARPMHPDWVRSIRNQCQKAGVAFFMKQWGEYAPQFPQYPREYRIEADDNVCTGAPGPAEGVLYRDGYFYDGVEHQPHVNVGAWWMLRVGKKAAGAMLDGREWREFPEVR